MPQEPPMAKVKKRIYKATGTSLQFKIKGPNGVIGTLTIEPNALNAISWLGKGKQEVSRKKKTLFNLVEWIQS
jgi:hypothetical protein